MPRSFLMTFNRENNFITSNQKNNFIQHLGTKKMVGGLNLPMIERVHRAKSGCSACGKKVM